ncbi:nuclear transport factor 2 family protein [Formosa sp. S-31]
MTDWSLILLGDALKLNDIRITGVLEKRNKSWAIVQIHASVPRE